MISSILRMTTLFLTGACALQAAASDISNLSHCIADVRLAAAHPPAVLTFDYYTANFSELIADLESAAPHLPHVYQEVAAKPLIQFLKNLGESQFLHIFEGDSQDNQTATLQQIIPDAALSILTYRGTLSQGIQAFEEIISDLYDGFLSEEARVSKQSGISIKLPTYGVIPPLVKFGNSDSGPYTWPGDATKEILGMGCGIVSLPPEQMKGGLIAWTSLGHETGGHDVTHAYQGLLDELAQKVHAAVLEKFKSKNLADYWAACIDETTADICGYLNMGPSLGIGLIGYFRALGDGKLRTIGSSDDPHPIDLLRGFLAASVAKRLHFSDAQVWSEAIIGETRKDKRTLYFSDQNGNLSPFPVSLPDAASSADVVAQVIMQSKLTTLQGHSLQEIQDWTDQDQAIVDELVTVLNTKGKLPDHLRGPGFYASYVVAAATQAAFQHGAQLPQLFNEMLSFLATMHLENPTWSQTPTKQSMALIERGLKGVGATLSKRSTRPVVPRAPELANQ